MSGPAGLGYLGIGEGKEYGGCEVVRLCFEVRASKGGDATSFEMPSYQRVEGARAVAYVGQWG